MAWYRQIRYTSLGSQMGHDEEAPIAPLSPPPQKRQHLLPISGQRAQTDARITRATTEAAENAARQGASNAAAAAAKVAAPLDSVIPAPRRGRNDGDDYDGDDGDGDDGDDAAALYRGGGDDWAATEHAESQRAVCSVLVPACVCVVLVVTVVVVALLKLRR